MREPPREFIIEVPNGYDPGRVWNDGYLFMTYSGNDKPDPLKLIKVREVITENEFPKPREVEL